MDHPLIAHVSRFVTLTPAEETLILQNVKHQKLRKKEQILQQGEICQANYFVVNGVMRMYMNTDAGLEQIVQFAIENWWVTDYTSLENQKPSEFNIQAVEPAEIYVLDKIAQEEIFTKVPLFERYFRKVLQRAFSASLMRLNYIFNESGEQRYRHFQESFPDFVQRVPQYMLASYLGFTPEFLSKVRGKKD